MITTRHKEAQNDYKHEYKVMQRLYKVFQYSRFVSLSVWVSCSSVRVVGGPLHVCVKGPIVSYSAHSCGLFGVTNSLYLLILFHI